MIFNYRLFKEVNLAVAFGRYIIFVIKVCDDRWNIPICSVITVCACLHQHSASTGVPNNSLPHTPPSQSQH